MNKTTIATNLARALELDKEAGHIIDLRLKHPFGPAVLTFINEVAEAIEGEPPLEKDRLGVKHSPAIAKVFGNG